MSLVSLEISKNDYLIGWDCIISIMTLSGRYIFPFNIIVSYRVIMPVIRDWRIGYDRR